MFRLCMPSAILGRYSNTQYNKNDPQAFSVGQCVATFACFGVPSQEDGGRVMSRTWNPLHNELHTTESLKRCVLCVCEPQSQATAILMPCRGVALLVMLPRCAIALTVCRVDVLVAVPLCISAPFALSSLQRSFVVCSVFDPPFVLPIYTTQNAYD